MPLRGRLSSLRIIFITRDERSGRRMSGWMDPMLSHLHGYDVVSHFSPGVLTGCHFAAGLRLFIESTVAMPLEAHKVAGMNEHPAISLGAWFSGSERATLGSQGSQGSRGRPGVRNASSSGLREVMRQKNHRSANILQFTLPSPRLANLGGLTRLFADLRPCMPTCIPRTMFAYNHHIQVPKKLTRRLSPSHFKAPIHPQWAAPAWSILGMLALSIGGRERVRRPHAHE